MKGWFENMHLPVLNVAAESIPERMLVVGDPERALRVASRFEDRVQLGHFREYLTLVGKHRGVEVGVVSHGVGAAGAAVAFDELFQAGVRRVIRAGSCGGMQDEVLDGHLVIVTGAVRNEGLSSQLVPDGYPAVASPDIVTALRRAARGGENIHEGLTLTNAVFYTNDILGSNLPLWQKAGVKAVEMECAALFVMAGLVGRECGAILTVDGNPLVERDEEMTGYNPHREIVREAVGRMIGIALDALVDNQ